MNRDENRTIPAATKLSEKHKKALRFVAGVLGRSESELIRSAIIDMYDLDTVSDEADSFFADSARLVEHYERRLHNKEAREA